MSQPFSYLLWTGVFLAVLMFLQQWHINSKTEEKWVETLNYYRKSVRIAAGLLVLGWCVLAALMLVPSFRDQYEILFQPWGPMLLILVAFFTGTVRLLFERSHENGTSIFRFIREFFGSFFQKNGHSEACHLSIKPTNHNSWIWVFGVSALLACLPYLGESLHKQFFAEDFDTIAEFNSADVRPKGALTLDDSAGWLTGGSGYTPGSHTEVKLKGATSAKLTALATVEVGDDGIIKKVTIVDPGFGYQAGEKLTFDSSIGAGKDGLIQLGENHIERTGGILLAPASVAQASGSIRISKVDSEATLPSGLKPETDYVFIRASAHQTEENENSEDAGPTQQQDNAINVNEKTLFLAKLVAQEGATEITDSGKTKKEKGFRIETLNAAADSHNPVVVGLVGLLANAVILFGYFCWVYVGAFRKLTDVHGFNEIESRRFLGALTNDLIPVQFVMIGPKNCGKSTLCRAEIRNDTFGTTKPEVVNFPVGETQDNLKFATAIDTPGECLGDHILIVSRFRADTLVLVLNYDEFDEKELVNPANYNTILDFSNTCKYRGHNKFQKKYLEAFSLATDQRATMSQELFRVKSFVLFINYRGSEVPGALSQMKESDKSKALLPRIACMMGQRFGVEADHCCVIAGCAPIPSQARGLLALLDSKSILEKSSWPNSAEFQWEDEFQEPDVDEEDEPLATTTEAGVRIV